LTDQFRFDSDSMPIEDAFVAYQRLYALGSDVQQGRGRFMAWVRAARFDGLLLFERRLNGVVHSRTSRAGRDGFQHFALHLVLSGALEGSRESRFDCAYPGDLVLADTLRASRTEAHDLHVLTASVPRRVIEAACGSTDQLHGHIVSAPRTHVLRDLMQSLVRNADDFSETARPSLRRAFHEILFATLSEPGAAQAVIMRIDLARREAAERFIAAHLGDRSLDAAMVAAGIGASRSVLYRLFVQDGGVARFIMARRLAAVRAALEGGSSEPLAGLAQSYGFTDESHLNRRFNKAYGLPAGAFRRSVSGEPLDGPIAAARRWTSWMIEVS
jgi:AraC-like DNA-binding protein